MPSHSRVPLVTGAGGLLLVPGVRAPGLRAAPPMPKVRAASAEKAATLEACRAAAIAANGILSNCNSLHGTMALQSIQFFGTEGRRLPETPPSSEIFNSVTLRGRDIKVLTVLNPSKNEDSAGNPSIFEDLEILG